MAIEQDQQQWNRTMNVQRYHAPSPEGLAHITAAIRRLPTLIYDPVYLYGDSDESLLRQSLSPAQYDDLMKMAQLALTPALHGPKGTQEAVTVVRALNDLHEQHPSVRFALTNKLQPKELFQLIVADHDDIYTSSFNGLLDRMLRRLHAEHKTMNDLVADPQLRPGLGVFFETVASYGRIKDVFATLPDDIARQKLLGTMFDTVDRDIRAAANDQNLHNIDALRPAAGLAEAMRALTSPQLRALFETNLMRRFDQADGKAKTAYGFLASAYLERIGGHPQQPELFAGKDFSHRYPLVNLESIPSSALFDVNGRHVQQMVFYDDDDSKGSFKEMLKEYKNHRGWKVEDHPDFVVITGSDPASHRQLIMVANKPGHKGSAAEAAAYLKTIHATPQYIIHRGHRNYADATLHDITPNTALVYWGSCGSYQYMARTLEISPKAHILYTQGEGTMYVNDPLLKLVNTYMLAHGDIHWNDLWAKATKLLRDERFEEYVRPNANFTAMFVRAYRQKLEQEGPTAPASSLSSWLRWLHVENQLQDFTPPAGVTVQPAGTPAPVHFASAVNRDAPPTRAT